MVHTETEALLIQRVTAPVFWQSVTGALEWGEAPGAAAIREVCEETGIRAAVLRETGIIRSFEIFEAARHLYAPGVRKNREYLFFLPVDRSCEIKLCEAEHQAYVWMPIRQAVDEVLSWTNALALRALL